MAISIDVAGRRAGQAMVESVIVLLIVCFLLFGMLEVSRAYAAREILHHAAASASRARTVGFNGWMCSKVMRAAAIPISGEMTVPVDAISGDAALASAISSSRTPGALWDWAVNSEPSAQRAAFEIARIPSFLASANDSRASNILDYKEWDDLAASGLGGNSSGFSGDTLTVSVRKRHSLPVFVRLLNDLIGFHDGGVDGKDAFSIEGRSDIEAHYPLYLDDAGW